MSDGSAPASRSELLEVSVRIADYLCETSYTHGGQCTWVGSAQQADPYSGDIRFYSETLGPTLYAGTSGVALFLAETYSRTGNQGHAATAAAAMAYALARRSSIPFETRFGFHSGIIGVAFAAARVGQLLGRPDLERDAKRVVTAVARTVKRHALLDVISGAAGSVTPLLLLADQLHSKALVKLAEQLGRRIIAGAQKGRYGLSWGAGATGFPTSRALTGLAHGAAGFGLALMELYGRLGDIRFLTAAHAAFRYENRWFRREQDNWCDFREAQSPKTAPCRVAWCHGAPGIGLARMRSLQLVPTRRSHIDAAAAARASALAIESSMLRHEMDFSLCHGLAGIAEFLILAAHQLGDHRIGVTAHELARSRAVRFGSSPKAWPCGVASGSNPSLMLGLAGIGYFYLRLSDPTVLSVLLPVPETSGRKALSN